MIYFYKKRYTYFAVKYSKLSIVWSHNEIKKLKHEWFKAVHMFSHQMNVHETHKIYANCIQIWYNEALKMQ